MNILAVESADGAASVACGSVDNIILRRNEEMRDSLTWFMQQVDELRATHIPHWSQLDLLACCTGPGGFTGVRVAVGYVQGLGLATGLPCIGVSSLDAMAAGQAARLAEQDKPVWLALDARMHELYLAQYRPGQGRLVRHGDMALLDVDAARQHIARDAVLAGPGFSAWPELFGAQTTGQIGLDAAGVLAAASRLSATARAADQLKPVYLRNQVAQTLAERGLS